MNYLIYHIDSKQVIEILSEKPEVIENGYRLAVSDAFSPGGEFEFTIWINEVDEEGFITSYSAIRNNPNAARLLRENELLKNENAGLSERITMQDLTMEDLMFNILPNITGGGF